MCSAHLIKHWALTAFLFAAVCNPIYGQESATVTSLRGFVRDTAGAGIAGASITVRHLATNQTRRVISESDGSYRVTALPVGTYEVCAEAPGFSAYINPQVELALGRAVTLDLTLRLGDVSAAVTVTDRPPMLDPDATVSTTSIDPERISELPVNSRNYLEFTLLAPGVAPSARQTTTGGNLFSSSFLADSGFTFGGLRPRSNSIAIDGLDNTDETTGAARVALSPEIVREFHIVNGGSSAEFGGAAGGTINVVTRTGSNNFHGSGFFYLQNERLNARSPLPPKRDDEPPRLRRTQFGTALGGPVKRDRIFFYLSFEQEHLSGEDQAEIDPGVLSQVNAALSSGFTPRLAVRSIDSKPFNFGQDTTEAAGKLTYLPNTQHTLNIRFALSNDRTRNNAFNNEALNDRTARGSSYTKDYQLTGSAVSVLSENLFNDLRYQASARHVVTHAASAEGPGVEITGLVRFGQPYDAETERREIRNQIVEVLSLHRSPSEWKGGLTLNHVSLSSDLREGFSGLYLFRTVGDFIAGRPAVWRQAFGDPHTGYGVTSIGAFLQNQWMVTPHLRLNLGLRYDTERLPAPFHCDQNNFSPRLSLAWNPSAQWVVRAGWGLFYDRLPLAYLNRAIQKNGQEAFEQVATGGDAARVFAASGGGRLGSAFPGLAPSVFRADPNFVTPYSAQGNIGVERLLSPDMTVRADYLFTSGIHLPRTRNVNLLSPVTLTPANAASLGIDLPTPQQLGRPVFAPQRIASRFDGIWQLENAAHSTYHGLTLTLNQRLSHEVQFLAAYTLSSNIDTASDFDEQPENPYALRAERALSRNHVRQRFVFNGIFELGEHEQGSTNHQKEHFLSTLFANLEVAPIITFSSGRPVNPLTGADENQSHAFPLTARPLGFPRNALHTPRFINVDLRLVKYFPLGGMTPYSSSGNRRVDFVIDCFNLFNHPNIVNLNPFYGSGTTALPSFRTPVAVALPRQIRLSIDFEF